MSFITRHRIELITALVLLALFAGMVWLFFGQHTDASFITYRVARHLAAGRGLTVNTVPRRLPAEVAPLYASLLSALFRWTPDLPLLGNLVGSISIGLATGSLVAALHPIEKITAGAAAAIFLTFPFLWHLLGLDAPFWLALCLLAVFAHLRAWAIPTVLLLVGAILTRPEAAILALVLLAHGIATGRRFSVLAAGLFGGGLAIGLIAFGSLVDAGSGLPGLPGVGGVIAAPDSIASHLPAAIAVLAAGVVTLSPLWPFTLLLIVPGLLKLKTAPPALILVGWAVLHLLILSILGVVPSARHLAPLIPALAALLALGAAWLVERVPSSGLRWTLGGIAALVIGGAATDSLVRLNVAPPADTAAYRALIPVSVTQPYTDAGAWLAENTAPGEAVAVARIGMLGYLSDRPLVDISGLLQPEIAAARDRGDGGWWLAEFAPPTLALTASQIAALPGYDPSADPWFNAIYREVTRFGPESDPLIIYTRTAVPLPLTEQLVGMVTYPGSLILNSIATDFTLEPLSEDRLGRIRLEWLLNASLDAPRHVSITIQARDGSVAALADSTISFDAWPTRQLLTTYHTVRLLPNLPPSVYDVKVGVGSTPDALTWQTLTIAKVPFENAVYLGGLSGSRADFGRLALQGYRLSRRPPAELEILLLWEAVEDPRVDYDILIQVRTMGGAVALQHFTEPYGGAYPTSIWSPGERVPDTYLLDVGTLPPGDYEVYAGLLDPDGSRLLTIDGRDAVFVGRITIAE